MHDPLRIELHLHERRGRKYDERVVVVPVGPVSTTNGAEDAEAERIKAERVAAYNAKKAAKPKTVAKVRLFLHLTRLSVVMCCAACIYDLSEYDVDLPRPVVRCHLRSEALG